MRVILLVIIFSVFSFAQKEYIKGEMTKRDYNPYTKLWEYKVKATDIKNGKLKEAEFSSPKRIMYLGNIVYCVIENGELQEIYKMGKAKKVQKTKKTQKTKSYAKKRYPKQKKIDKTIKKGNKKVAVELPRNEVIDLN